MLFNFIQMLYAFYDLSLSYIKFSSMFEKIKAYWLFFPYLVECVLCCLIQNEHWFKSVFFVFDLLVLIFSFFSWGIFSFLLIYRKCVFSASVQDWSKHIQVDQRPSPTQTFLTRPGRPAGAHLLPAPPKRTDASDAPSQQRPGLSPCDAS